MEIFKEIIPHTQEYLWYAFACILLGGAILFSANFAMKRGRLTKEKNENIFTPMCGMFLILGMLFVIVACILPSEYIYKVIITDNDMFAQLAKRGYKVFEVYPGLNQNVYEIVGPVLDWLP